MVADRRIDDALDEIDRTLLNALQADFPLVSAPFAEIGARLGISEAEAIERTKLLKESGIIRQISAIFDSRALGYGSTLAAMQVEPEKLDEVAALVSRESGVSHNYARNHAYNLWFTLTLPPGSDPRQSISELAAKVGITKWLYLPATKVFKIGVRLNMMEDGEESLPAPGESGVPSQERQAVEIDPAIVRALQDDIEITSHPFAAPALRIGLSEGRLLEEGIRLRDAGVMRRFAAVLRHRQAGFSANGMGAWIVPEERIEEVGAVMASFPQVTHCYQRPAYPDWPYSMFTMIHARTTEECESIAKAISEKTGIGEYSLLFSTKEYKKVRVRYFE